jgi:hypothetical protein
MTYHAMDHKRALEAHRVLKVFCSRCVGVVDMFLVLDMVRLVFIFDVRDYGRNGIGRSDVHFWL